MSPLRQEGQGESARGLPAFMMLLLLVLSGTLAILQFPAAHAAGASSVGSTTSASGLGFASDGFTCGANGRFWVFYNDGSLWGWQSSPDGQTWSTRSTFTTAVPVPPAGSNNMVFDCSSSSVYYAGGKESSDTNFYYGTGTLNSDGTITWAAETSQVTHGYIDAYPSLAIDSNGNVWVAIQTQDASGSGTVYIEIFERSIAWTSSTTLAFPSSAPNPQIVPLTSGRMALLLGNPGGATGLETFDGSTWTTRASTTGTGLQPLLSTAVTIGDTIEYCASDATNVYYMTFSYSGTAWSSPSTIGPGLACSDTTDGTSTLALFYLSSHTTISYEQSNNGGSSFQSPVTVSSIESGVNVVGASLAISTNPAKQAMVVWLSNYPSPKSVRFANIATAAAVNEVVTITGANAQPTGTATVTGCHAAVSSIPMDGLPHTFGADPGCALTLTVPTDATYSRYRFPGSSTTWTFTTGSVSPDAHSNTAYYQYSVTASYSYSGGTGAPPYPTLTSTQSGSPYSTSLTLSPTINWLDGSASWNVTPVLTRGTQTWVTGSPTSGVVTGPMVISFAYSPPVPPVTTTTTVTDTTTSTVTIARTTVTSTTTSTPTTTVTSTVVTSTTVTSTSVVTSTTTITTAPSSVPSASSLTCDQSRPRVNQHVNCTDIVSTADSGIAAGSVSFTTSGGGTFDKQNCEWQSKDEQLQCQVQYTPRASGVQTLTATYTGDPYHGSSSDTATVFAGDTSSSLATSLSLTCDQTFVQLGKSTNCQATVLTADGGAPTGSVAWTASDLGVFSHQRCDGPGPGPDKNGQLECSATYTPSATGGQVVTAAYSRDLTRNPSSNTFQVFVQNGDNAQTAQQAISLAPVGAILIGGITIVAFDAKKARGRRPKAAWEA